MRLGTTIPIEMVKVLGTIVPTFGKKELIANWQKNQELLKADSWLKINDRQPKSTKNCLQ